MIIAGIDPDAGGVIALQLPAGTCRIYGMLVFQLQHGGKAKRESDAYV